MDSNHAYLIMAHDNICVLEKLLELLDDMRNDIYVHCDIKMGNLDEWIYNIKKKIKTKVTFISRNNIRWAAWSQTETILDLLEIASNTRGGINIII